MSKPILCLDFDGVLHSYESGWRGADVIPDLPVPGAMEFIVEAVEKFEVHIFSSRSNQDGGISAMRSWLLSYLTELIGVECYTLLAPQLIFDTVKPPAMVTLDDRAITFTGKWPDVNDLLTFKPWNK